MMQLANNLTKEAFTIPRAPSGIARYVAEIYEYIAANNELTRAARLRKEPYKTFLEELMPFSQFRTWKYGERDDVVCALVSGTPSRDATIKTIKTGIEHSVEITWPIDGRECIQQGQQLNERGYADITIFSYEDITLHQTAIDRVIATAKKKALRDYREPGGSSIIFVFDRPLFWDSDPKHVELLQSLKTQLSEIPLLTENIFLMLLLGDQPDIIKI